MLRALLFASFLAAAAAARPSWRELSAEYDFETYLADFGKDYGDPLEHARRRALFQRNLGQILLHNARPDATYRKGVNAFTDLAEEEMSALRGNHKATLLRSATPRAAPDHLLGSAPKDAAIDWRERGVVTPVKNQGSCGSCWAFAATETLESAVAIATGELLELAPQEFVSCAENPNKCGGTGGCAGATAEIAFEYAAANGVVREQDYPYTAQDGSCGAGALMPAAANVTGLVRLPRNELKPVINAILRVGPVVVSVSADWASYEEGILPASECATDIDHAVQLVGIGYDEKLDMHYYLVRNSWGPSWGEGGYIRLERQLTQEETPCGEDLNTADGVACEGDPVTAKVCGACGILFDVAYPTGATLA